MKGVSAYLVPILMLVALSVASPIGVAASSGGDDGFPLVSLKNKYYIVIYQMHSEPYTKLEYYILGGHVGFFMATIQRLTGSLPKIEPHYPARLYYSSAGKGYRVAELNITCTGCGGVQIRILVAETHLAVFKAYTNTSRYRVLGERFASILKQVIKSIGLRWVNSVEVKYAGLHAEKMVYTNDLDSVERLYGTDIYVVNETDHYIVYVHPYEKYYVYLNGIRVVYPIVVKGAYENETGGLPFTYMFEGLLLPEDPALAGRQMYSESIIESIAEAYNDFIHRDGIDSRNYTVDEIRVYDYYLAPYRYEGQITYTPMIVVGVPRSTAYMWIQFTPDGRAKIQGAGVLLGKYRRMDPSLNLDAIFTPAKQAPVTGNNGTDNPNDNEEIVDNNIAANNPSTSIENNTATQEQHINEPPANDATMMPETHAQENTATGTRDTVQTENQPAPQEQQQGAPATYILITISLLAGIAIGAAATLLYTKH